MLSTHRLFAAVTVFVATTATVLKGIPCCDHNSATQPCDNWRNWLLHCLPSHKNQWTCPTTTQPHVTGSCDFTLGTEKIVFYGGSDAANPCGDPAKNCSKYNCGCTIANNQMVTFSAKKCTGLVAIVDQAHTCTVKITADARLIDSSFVFHLHCNDGVLHAAHFLSHRFPDNGPVYTAHNVYRVKYVTCAVIMSIEDYFCPGIESLEPQQ